MTTTRWLIVAIGAAGIAAACVYPPWEECSTINLALRRDRGRALLFAPPAKVDYWNVTIATRRLGIELLAVLAATAFLFGVDSALNAWDNSIRKHPHPIRKVIIDVLATGITAALVILVVVSVYGPYKRKRLADERNKENEALIREIDEVLGKK